MTVVGGFRERLIRDSLYYLVRDSLEALGWLDAGRHHRPLDFRVEPLAHDEEINPNLIVISGEGTRDDDAELGSTLGEIRTTYYVDFYAESNALGEHVIHDVRDILRGRMSSIGRTASILPVFDYTLTTPIQLFSCDIEDVVVDRARDFPKPWQKHWFACRLDILDGYASEDD